MWQLNKYDGDKWHTVAEHSTETACHIEAIERGYVLTARGRRYMQPDVRIVEMVTGK